MKRRRTTQLNDDSRNELLYFRAQLAACSSSMELFRLAGATRKTLDAARERMGLEYAKNDMCRDAMMTAKKDPELFRISDHAVIRYLERVKGFDVKAVRREIRDYADKHVPPGTLSEVITTPDDLKIALSNSGIVTSIWGEPGD